MTFCLYLLYCVMNIILKKKTNWILFLLHYIIKFVSDKILMTCIINLLNHSFINCTYTR